jgi:SCP-2 sterol transfer family
MGAKDDNEETSMTDVTAEFLAELGRRDHVPLLADVSATLGLELAHGGQVDHWLVTIDYGKVEVDRADAPADCLVRTERALFDEMVTGRANAMAAMLRGALTFQGDAAILVQFQRLFAGPPASARQQPVGTGRRPS